MGDAGGVNSHVASICPISWTNKLICFSSKNQLGDDSSGLPGRVFFLLHLFCSCNSGTCVCHFGRISNNKIDLSIKNGVRGVPDDCLAVSQQNSHTPQKGQTFLSTNKNNSDFRTGNGPSGCGTWFAANLWYLKVVARIWKPISEPVQQKELKVCLSCARCIVVAFSEARFSAETTWETWLEPRWLRAPVSPKHKLTASFHKCPKTGAGPRHQLTHPTAAAGGNRKPRGVTPIPNYRFLLLHFLLQFRGS